jgi:pyridoxamine 5'-phosphate oxidase
LVSSKKIADLRRDYGALSLDESDLPEDPLTQFTLWFEGALESEAEDPTAMVLSTVDEKGNPDSRVVLLKGIEDGSFLFYTNYHSTKGRQVQHHPQVALNFYWPTMVRQVRIRGRIQKISAEKSDAYFLSRPFKSQQSAVVSPQSQEIPNRSFLEDALKDLEQSSHAMNLSRPKHWGGYQIIPSEIEFWQGRDNRLHDRIQYYKNKQGQWLYRRLAP